MYVGAGSVPGYGDKLGKVLGHDASTWPSLVGDLFDLMDGLGFGRSCDHLASSLDSVDIDMMSVIRINQAVPCVISISISIFPIPTSAFCPPQVQLPNRNVST